MARYLVLVVVVSFFFATPETHEAIKKELSDLVWVPVGLVDDGSEIIFRMTILASLRLALLNRRMPRNPRKSNEAKFSVGTSKPNTR